MSSWVARPAPSERLPDRRTPCGARALLLSDERRGRLDSDASGREAHCPPPCSGRRPSSARAGWRAAACRREAKRDTRKHARQLLRGWWQRRRAAIGVARHYAVPLFRSHAAAWGRACDGPQPLVALHEVDHLGAAVELLRERRAEARLDECQQVLIRHERNATVEERLSPQREAQTPTSKGPSRAREGDCATCHARRRRGRCHMALTLRRLTISSTFSNGTRRYRRCSDGSSACSSAPGAVHTRVGVSHQPQSRQPAATRPRP